MDRAISEPYHIIEEKRKLERAIRQARGQLQHQEEVLDRILLDTEEFRDAFDRKVGALYRMLNDLDEQIFKYRHLGEVVDRHFPREEAEAAFDDVMGERAARLEQEYRRVREIMEENRRNSLSEGVKAGMRELYRRLVRIFHPDIHGGDGRTMMKINHAYATGDIDALRELEQEHGKSAARPDSVDSLRDCLETLSFRIREMNRRIREAKSSDMYVMRSNVYRNGPDADKNLYTLAATVRREILKKEQYLDVLKRRVAENSR